MRRATCRDPESATIRGRSEGLSVGDPAYLIRYGVMGYVGRFRVAPECGGPLDRGQTVVIQSERGVELGEVLVPLDEAGAARAADRQHIIRPAGPEDLDRSRRAEASRADRFATCRRVLEEEGWPWDLIDVEPLLEDGATVIQYLGPHHIDVAAIRARFRMTCDLDVVLEPVGTDEARHRRGRGRLRLRRVRLRRVWQRELDRGEGRYGRLRLRVVTPWRLRVLRTEPDGGRAGRQATAAGSA